jgi:hypothetical protein
MKPRLISAGEMWRAGEQLGVLTLEVPFGDLGPLLDDLQADAHYDHLREASRIAAAGRAPLPPAEPEPAAAEPAPESEKPEPEPLPAAPDKPKKK